jgi:hypothetical protein
MSRSNSHSDKGFPNWDELMAFIENKNAKDEETSMLLRINNNAAKDLAGEGLKKYLQISGNNPQTLRSWINEAKKRPIKAQNRKKIGAKLAAAASILAIVSIAIYYFAIQSDKNQWKQMYKTDPGFPVLMGSTEENDLWMQQFRYGNYQTALDLLKTKRTNDTTLFYGAICFFELGETNLCLGNLNRMKKNYQGKASLLEAFCSWREGNLLMAKQQFSKLCATENGIAAAQACTILKSAF